MQCNNNCMTVNSDGSHMSKSGNKKVVANTITSFIDFGDKPDLFAITINSKFTFVNHFNKFCTWIILINFAKRQVKWNALARESSYMAFDSVILNQIIKNRTLSTLREKCPNTEFFLVCVLQHSDWMRRSME